jgi:hypothetical protein
MHYDISGVFTHLGLDSDQHHYYHQQQHYDPNQQN